MDNLPQTPTQPAQPVSSSPEPSQRPDRAWLRSKLFWGAVVVFLLLFSVGTLVPVSKIPFLRNLAYAMGYTPDETKSISFLKALLSWNGHAKMMRGELPDPDEAAVFGTGGGFLASASGRAQNNLIDIRSVNKALARQGQQPGDQIANSAEQRANLGPNAGRADDTDPGRGSDGSRADVVRLTKNDAVANTEANQVQADAVFFGEDTSLIARDKNDAFDSINTLKKVANKPMSGASVGSGTDWFGRAVDRAIQQDAKVPEVAKELDKSGMAFTKLGGMRNLGDSRAKRDLYYAWLMARAARRTPQIILKKTLASASFDGAEMPRTVFTSSGGSGVAVRSDEIQLDMTNVQKYLDQDKDCQSALSRTAKELPKQDDLDSQIAALPGAFPATCGARSDSTYPTILQSIGSSCQQMKAAYEHARVGCSSMSINVQDSQCQSVTLGNYYSAFEAYCTKEKDKCAQLEDAEERAKCEKSADNLKSDEEFYDPADPKVKYKKSELDGEGGAVATTFYNQDGNFNTDYFPGVDWKHSLWIDPNAGK